MCCATAHANSVSNSQLYIIRSHSREGGIMRAELNHVACASGRARRIELVNKIECHCPGQEKISICIEQHGHMCTAHWMTCHESTRNRTRLSSRLCQKKQKQKLLNVLSTARLWHSEKIKGAYWRHKLRVKVSISPGGRSRPTNTLETESALLPGRRKDGRT